MRSQRGWRRIEAKHDIEPGDLFLNFGARDRHKRHDELFAPGRIAQCIELWVAGIVPFTADIALRHETWLAGHTHGDINVRRARADSTGAHGDKAVLAVAVANGLPVALKIFITAMMLIEVMAAGIGLPDFDLSARNWLALRIDNLPEQLDHNTAGRLGVHAHLGEIIVAVFG